MKFLKYGILTLVALSAWIAFTLFVAFYGWWMKPVAPQGNHDAFFEEARGMIDALNLGNTAFILVENGEVVGEYYAKPERSVDKNTVFPTASFSKWITALGVLSLVEEGQISLDDPVSKHLTRWRLPDSTYDNNEVTIRRLLSHMSGLTDGLGFGDYESTEAVPALEQSLAEPRASSGQDVKIVVGDAPGEAFNYSGGGYLILQLLIEEVSGEAYQGYIQKSILDPLQMSDSSFEFIGDVLVATQSFDQAGNTAPQYRYAAVGATGFASSAADLLLLVKAVMSSDNKMGLSRATLRSMREPEAFVFGSGIWGLGAMLYAPTKDGNYVYGHDGANEPAINVAVRINPETKDAYIMLVNGHPSLASDIGAEWVLWQTGLPDLLSTERVLKSAFLPAVIGGVIIFVGIFLIARRF